MNEFLKLPLQNPVRTAETTPEGFLERFQWLKTRSELV